MNFIERRHYNFNDVLQAKFLVEKALLHPNYRIDGKVCTQPARFFKKYILFHSQMLEREPVVDNPTILWSDNPTDYLTLMPTIYRIVTD